jgi:hypothetical protein
MLPMTLLEPLLNTANNIIDKIIPNAKEATELKNKFAVQIHKLDQKDTEGFRDFILAYEGRGDQMPLFIQILRGSVRPILTYFLAIIYAWGFLNPDEVSPEFMTGLFQLNVISLGFWYGERALKNLGLNLGGKK